MTDIGAIIKAEKERFAAKTAELQAMLTAIQTRDPRQRPGAYMEDSFNKAVAMCAELQSAWGASLTRLEQSVTLDKIDPA